MTSRSAAAERKTRYLHDFDFKSILIIEERPRAPPGGVGDEPPLFQVPEQMESDHESDIKDVALPPARPSSADDESKARHREPWWPRPRSPNRWAGGHAEVPWDKVPSFISVSADLSRSFACVQCAKHAKGCKKLVGRTVCPRCTDGKSRCMPLPPSFDKTVAWGEYSTTLH